MTARQRLRPLITAFLLFVHAHSLVFFVCLLSVASDDLASPNTTSPINLTSIVTILTSTNSTESRTFESAEFTTIESTTAETTTINSTVESFDGPREASESITQSTTPEITTQSTASESTPQAVSEKERWHNFDICHAKNEELEAYKRYLEEELANVTQLLTGDPDKKSKRYIPLPISSSLPDHVASDFVLARLNSSLNDAENTTQIDESETPADGKKQSVIEDRSKDDRKTSDEEDEKFVDPSRTPKELAIVREVNTTEKEDSKSSSKYKLFGVQTTHLTDTQPPDEDEPQTRRSSFEPTHNHTTEECKQLTQAELVTELKQKGSYNPNLMAWDVYGVFRFLDRSIVDQYERQIKSHKSNKQAVQRNIEALERILAELNLHCDVRAPDVLSRLGNLTISEPRRTAASPSIRTSEEEVRFKRNILAEDLLRPFNSSRSKDDPPPSQSSKRQKMIGDVHVVPFGCDKRGEEEDGYLRLCGACQAIRKLPDTFFPPFINEVMCDEDRACLYFYDYPHGKCKQKHMNFVVLRNVGTATCQVWQKFNLNVRVSCECFVDSMSFFSKYV